MIDNKDLTKQIEHWIKTQHGSAGWGVKLENFILEYL